MAFFQIPGNIKTSLVPFVLDPGNEIHQSGVQSSTSVRGTPQFFSYRNLVYSKYANNSGNLQFFPSSIKSLHITDDVSYKLLYGFSGGTKMKTPNSLTVNDILNNIPGVQIREYLPDTRLDQCINMFVDLFKNMTKLFAGDDDKKKKQGEASAQETKNTDEADLFKKISACAWFTMKYMVGGYGKQGPSLLGDLGDFGLDTSLLSGCDPDVRRYVVNFPYTMYYNLQSCVTTNIYEVPGTESNKRIGTADGSAGWGSGDDFMSSGGFRVSNLLGKIPVLGDLANMILGNVGINYTPWWNAKAGTDGSKEPGIEIKFDLFNDSAQAAMINFIFVNTIIPNNKWVQYNMFQHSSNLFDVKIEGVNRLFACSGNFSVTYDGILRNPPLQWVKDLCSLHCNKSFDSEKLQQAILSQKLIKIPDVYHVTLQFQSLLPANFNNYLFTYACNNTMDAASTEVYQQSEFAKILPRAISKYTERVTKVWNSGEEYDGMESNERSAVEKEEAAEKAREKAEQDAEKSKKEAEEKAKGKQAAEEREANNIIIVR